MSLLLLESTGSTQDELVQRLRSGEQIDAVAAAMQTAGRGRFGRAWNSPLGESLALSVALTMPPEPRAAPFVGMALAARVAERYGVAVQWPNDVTYHGRKVAGILIEGMEVAGERRLVLGVGVNLGQSRFPEEIADRATSLRLIHGREFDWQQEAHALYDLARIPSPPDFSHLAPLWSKLDETVGKRYRSAEGRVGIARGVDAEGHLLLKGTVGGVSVAEAYFGPQGSL